MKTKSVSRKSGSPISGMRWSYVTRDGKIRAAPNWANCYYDEDAWADLRTRLGESLNILLGIPGKHVSPRTLEAILALKRALIEDYPAP